MQNCRDCGRLRYWRKTDKTARVNGHIVRVWRCRCGNEQNEVPPQYENTKPSILYFDIERAPGLAYYYDRKVTGGYIPTKFLKEEPFVICWAATWWKDTTTHPRIISAAVTPQEGLRGAKGGADRRILKELWTLLDGADYVVGHNVNGFDVKKINNRFIQLGMGLPYTFSTLDTLKWSRKYFPFESNGLDYISVKLGGRPKLEIDFDDWKRIVETGDEKTLRKAERYCRGDVREGASVFGKMKRTIESCGVKVVK